MQNKSVIKLQKAGYIFLRLQDQEGVYIIKYSDSFGAWKTLEKFKTKASRLRRLNELLEEEKYLFDE
jgi:hypothetical protein